LASDSTAQQDLRTYARILWRWKFLFVAFLVVIPLGVWLVERGQQKTYQSSTLMQFGNVSVGSAGVSGAPVVSGNLAAVARLVSTTPVGNLAARLLHQPPGSVIGEVSASADPNTGFLTISARDHDPARAAAVANAFATALAKHQANQAAAIIRQDIAALQKQLGATSRSDPGTRLSLTQQISQLQTLQGSNASGATVIQAATPSATPVAPHTRRAVELALVIAVLLGLGAVLLAENADRRLRTPDDIEGLTGWPLLGAIPPSAFSPDHRDDPRTSEAFQMLGGALTYFNVERPLRSVAIVSPQVGAGKTTVAVGLAVATARAGKRAVLIDADLRRPQVSARLGIAEDAGLGAVLTGEQRLEEVIFEYPVDPPDGGRMLVLSAGRTPPNPAALLGSKEMGELLRRLEAEADLVIVDTVASLAVSDSLPLLKAVSGNVVVVRMNRTPGAALRRLQKIIESAHGTVFGAVATGSGAVAPGYGTYPYGYGGRDGRAAGIFGRLRGRTSPAAERAASNGALKVRDEELHPETPARNEVGS
jgi:non-specific protein-tyrosine kinase